MDSQDIDDNPLSCSISLGALCDPVYVRDRDGLLYNRAAVLSHLPGGAQFKSNAPKLPGVGADDLIEASEVAALLKVYPNLDVFQRWRGNSSLPLSAAAMALNIAPHAMVCCVFFEYLFCLQFALIYLFICLFIYSLVDHFCGAQATMQARCVFLQLVPVLSLAHVSNALTYDNQGLVVIVRGQDACSSDNSVNLFCPLRGNEIKISPHVLAQSLSHLRINQDENSALKMLQVRFIISDNLWRCFCWNYSNC